MFIETGWQNSVIALLAAINTLAGAPGQSEPIAPLSAADIVKISAALQDGSYRPAHWFDGRGNSSPILRIPAAAPAVDGSAGYQVLVMPIAPSMAERLSKRSGIVFEDPFYAVLASYNLARFGQPWVEVLVPGRELAWSRRSSIVAAIAGGTYRPEQYFQRAGPALAGAGQVPLSVHVIAGADLEKLYFLGLADLALEGGMAGLYQLYKYQAPQRAK
jgi:hypothetical protein